MKSTVVKCVQRFEEELNVRVYSHNGTQKSICNGEKSPRSVLQICMEEPKRSLRRAGLQHDISHVGV